MDQRPQLLGNHDECSRVMATADPSMHESLGNARLIISSGNFVKSVTLPLLIL